MKLLWRSGRRRGKADGKEKGKKTLGKAGNHGRG